jgi:predicted alpha/beta superfamily hydrolase
MRRSILASAALGLALAFSAPALAEPLKVVSETPPVLPGYSQFVLHSDRIGRDFWVTVNAPSTVLFLPGQKLPAIYALDAGYGIAGPQGSLLSGTEAMAPAIIVSVGYRTNEAVNRNTDLLHNKLTQDGRTIGGGGAAFEAFLLEDLKPFIEAKFPADPARAILFGHSFGGLFAANVFADKPDAFAGYVIGSASAWADPALVARVAAAAPKATGQRVYLSVGEKEGAGRIGGSSQMTDGFNSLSAALKGRPGVILKTQLYAGETHLSYYPRLITDGFPWVLPPALPLGAAQVKLPAETLARYSGVYDLPDGRKLTIKAMPTGELTAQVTDLPQVPLQQNGKDRFYTPTTDIDAVFDGTSLTLSGGGAKLRVLRETAP